MTLPEVESRVGLTRGDASAMNQPRARTTAIEAFAGLSKDLSDASFEIVRQRQAATAMREISDMKLMQDARMKQLAENTAPGKSVVESGMDMFVKEANDFIDRQPSYMRDFAREKMLMLRDSTAQNLLGLEAQLASEQLALDTEVFANNTLNGVRYGTMDEATGIAESEDFAKTLPPRIQEKFFREMRDGVRVMSLAHASETSPDAVLKAIKSGKYNDLKTSQLERIENQAQNIIDRREREALARQKDAIEYQNKIDKARRSGDFLTAAQLQLRADTGEDDFTNDQLIEAQKAMGALPTQVTLVDKEMANFWGDRLSATSSPDQFKAELEQYLSDFPTEQERNIALNDLKKNSDMDGKMEILVDSAFSHNGVHGSILHQGAFKALKDPDVVKNAKNDLKKMARDDNGFASTLTALDDRLLDLRMAATLSDIDPTIIDDYVQSHKDAASVAIRDLKVSGKNVTDKIINAMFDEIGPNAIVGGHLRVRKELADSITNTGIEKAKRRVLNERNLFVGVKKSDTGEMQYFTKEDNPKLWQDQFGDIINNVDLVNGGSVGTMNYFHVKGLADYIYEIDARGNFVPVIITEHDLIEGSKVKRSMVTHSINEGL